MADILKYDMTNIWASAGDVVAPDDDKIRAGWGVEVVPRQWWNWFENRQDNNLAYILQKGFPEWDATTEYIINKSYVQRNGIVYKATATTTGVDPVGLVSWIRVFADYSVSSNALGGIVPVANNIPYFTSGTAAGQFPSTPYGRGVSNLANIAAALTYFGAQASNTNLTALSALTGVANALPYFNGGSTMTTTTLTSYGRSLIDDADANAARATLGLGTVATADTTISQTDTTVGAILKVGDFGLGSGQSIPQISDLTVELRAGFYLVPPNATGLPAEVATVGAIAIVLRSNFITILSNYSNSSRTMYHGSRSGSTGALNWLSVWDSSNLVKTTSSTDATAGRMLKVGDFGVGGALSALTVDSLDAVVLGGFYITSVTPTPLPAGFAAGRYLLQVTGSSAYASQTLISPLNGNTANRGWNGTTWSSWNIQYGSVDPAFARTNMGLNVAATAPVTGSGNTVMSASPALTGTPTAPTASSGTSTTQIATTAFVVANASSNPAGTVLAYAGATIPDGYLLANGAAVSRTTYSALFTAISTTYGAGDGTTTFLIPDLRGEFLRGLDNGRGIDSGRSLGTFQNWQLANHSHTFTGTAYAGHTHTGTTASDTHSHTVSGTTSEDGAHTHTIPQGGASASGNGLISWRSSVGGIVGSTSSAGAHTHTLSGTASNYSHTHAVTTDTSGAFTPAGVISDSGTGTNGSENRVRNVAVQFLIKY